MGPIPPATEPRWRFTTTIGLIGYWLLQLSVGHACRYGDLESNERQFIIVHMGQTYSNVIGCYK